MVQSVPRETVPGSSKTKVYVHLIHHTTTRPTIPRPLVSRETEQGFSETKILVQLIHHPHLHRHDLQPDCYPSHKPPPLVSRETEPSPAMSAHFDFILLGQGLAGTTLAWYLRWLGATVLVVDREAEVTSSKIAAGLITPITGQKLNRTWRQAELWAEALSFYERTQAETGVRFFRQTPMLRLFASDLEPVVFQRRLAAKEFEGCSLLQSPVINDEWFLAERSGFEMHDAGQLDVRQYLAASRQQFQRDGGYRACDIDLSRDLLPTPEGVFVEPLAAHASKLIFCQGFDPIPNPWFHQVRLKPAKGEILTLRIPGLDETRVVHRGVWLAPLGNHLFKAGATYDWHRLDQHPTDKGRTEILDRLAEFVRCPIEVVDHQAAVRPVHRNQYPVLGLHPVLPQFGYFNGLGSKGSLHAPFFARHFTNVLRSGSAIDPEVDLNRKTDWTNPPPSPHGEDRPIPPRKPQQKNSLPLTQQAQAAIREVLQVGDIAIDATTGNGYDTLFLANLVGPRGTVYALDIQQAALDSTAIRLDAANQTNVNLIHADHADLEQVIPREAHHKIAAVMFNLGYLPGGDKQVLTHSDSTCRALRQAADLIKPGGVITILAYTGHDGGLAEAHAVETILAEFDPLQFERTTIESQPGRTLGPRLFLVTKRP